MKAKTSGKKTTQVVSTASKYTTLEELEKKTRGPVYVMNNLKQEMRANIVVPIARKNGNGYDVVRIPPTFIPVDLTHQVSKTQLMDSTEFRRTVQQRLVRLISPEYAAAILETEMGRKESAAVMDAMSRAKAMVESEMLSGKKSSIVKDEDDEDYESEVDDDQEEDSTVANLKRTSPLNRTEKQKKILAEAQRNKSDRHSKETVEVDAKFKFLVKSLIEDAKKGSSAIIGLRNYRRPLLEAEHKFAEKKFAHDPEVMRYLKREKERAK
jgi:hypothetical protein